MPSYKVQPDSKSYWGMGLALRRYWILHPENWKLLDYKRRVGIVMKGAGSPQRGWVLAMAQIGSMILGWEWSYGWRMSESRSLTAGQRQTLYPYRRLVDR